MLFKAQTAFVKQKTVFSQHVQITTTVCLSTEYHSNDKSMDGGLIEYSECA